MFSVPRPNWIESSEGFSVGITKLGALTYREGDHEMSVEFEPLAGPVLFVVYRSSMSRWKPPYVDDVVTAKERERIASNIREAFRSQGDEIEVW